MKNIITSLLIITLMINCKQNTSENKIHKNNLEKENNTHTKIEEHEKGTVSLTKQQMNAINLELVTIQSKKMNIAVNASGNLEVAPHHKADISSIIGGIVKNIYVIEGDYVKKGKIMARIEHPDIVQMQQDYINNLNSLNFLEKEYNRRKILYQEKVGSGKEFQKITAEYKNSKINLKAQKMKLNILGLNITQIEKGNILPYINIVSPLNGKVSLVETNIGTYAAPLTKLFEIVNNDELHADVMVFEKDISKIKIGQKITFTTTSISNKEFSGKIHAISPVFEENPKAIHVHAEIKNKDKVLIPGMYIHGQIIADNVFTDVLPEKAIITENEKTYIFIKINEEHNHITHNKENKNEISDKKTHNHNENGSKHNNILKENEYTFKMIEIITGIKNKDYIEVKLLNNLPNNVKVVANGAYFLLAEIGKEETEHSH